MELPHCSTCGSSFFYPRPFCPQCWSENIDYKLVSGSGTVWSYTIVRFAHGNAGHLGLEVPYAVVLVTLDEGVRMMGNLIACPPEQVKIGMRVQLEYRLVEGRTYPLYRPLASAAVSVANPDLQCGR
jgi:uncharacterized OB-fold protein